MSKNHKAIKTCRGQTLLEVLIVLSVTLVIITSILGLINANTRKATLARQTSEAIKLVQEGLETVRSIRNSNAYVVKVGMVGAGAGTSRPCSNPPNCIWSDLYSLPQGELDAHLSVDTLVDNNSTTPPYEEVSLGAAYRRTITISDVPDGLGNICGASGLPDTSIKRVTVRVEWDNPAGLQFREATSCLTQ
jgi:type II secretory pathway pseudopilin PulG